MTLFVFHIPSTILCDIGDYCVKDNQILFTLEFALFLDVQLTHTALFLHHIAFHIVQCDAVCNDMVIQKGGTFLCSV
jgi:hypothetical protein